MADRTSSSESHLRSLLKAMSWRIMATSTTGLIAWGITGNTGTATKIAGIEFFIKFAVYYFHERVWQLVPRGTIRRIYRPLGKEGEPDGD